MAEEAVQDVEARRRWLWGAAHAALALAILGGVWVALPARWWPVDLGGSALAALLLVSAASLVSGRAWAWRVARVAAGVLLAIGLALFTALAWTAAHLAGLYGPVGGGGAMILAAVAALLLPYFVGLPLLQLWSMRAKRHA